MRNNEGKRKTEMIFDTMQPDSCYLGSPTKGEKTQPVAQPAFSGHRGLSRGFYGSAAKEELGCVDFTAAPK